MFTLCRLRASAPCAKSSATAIANASGAGHRRISVASRKPAPAANVTAINGLSRIAPSSWLRPCSGCGRSSVRRAGEFIGKLARLSRDPPRGLARGLYGFGALGLGHLLERCSQLIEPLAQRHRLRTQIAVPVLCALTRCRHRNMMIAFGEDVVISRQADRNVFQGLCILTCPSHLQMPAGHRARTSRRSPCGGNTGASHFQLRATQTVDVGQCIGAKDP